MKINKEEIVLTIGTFSIWLILIVLLLIEKKSREEFYLNKKIENLESQFLITTEMFDKISESVANIKINSDFIVSILYTKDYKKRLDIYNYLYKSFTLLKSYGYKDIMFLLPEGTVFLDMETPEKYGRKLINIDRILVISNNLNSYIDKRFYDSIIYSYPLFYKNNFVGTVYFIIPLYTIGKNLSSVFKNKYVFYIKKEFISLQGKKGFVQSEFSPSYFVDKQFYSIRLKNNPEETNLISDINLRLKEDIKKLLQNEESFSLPYNHNNTDYIITFYSIKDLNSKHIGYLVSYEKDKSFKEFSKIFYLSSILITVIVLLIFTFLRYTLKMKAIAEKNAITDKLTGALNRMAIEPVINIEYERAKRNKKPISIILFDIDFFKKINDTYGHNTGDYVLKKTAEIVKRNTRKIDYLIRWGGEEFLILMPETDLEFAVKVAEKLRVLVENYQFKDVGKVTISLGVTQIKIGEKLDHAIKRADDALYLAKNRGRNRVEFDNS